MEECKNSIYQETPDNWVYQSPYQYPDQFPVGNPPFTVNAMVANQPKQVEKLLVFYTDIGQLPVSNAEAFLDNCKSKHSELTEKLKAQRVECIWLPVRSGGTRVEVINLL